MVAFDNPNERGVDRERLVKAGSLRNALELFGIAAGDRVDVRDLVIYTCKIEEELKAALGEFQRKRDYEGAARTRDRLSQLKREFVEMQLENKEASEEQERRNLRSAKQILKRLEIQSADAAREELEKLCEKKMADLLHAHEIQRNNLETYIANLHRPRVRYSKTLLDMMHSERHMTKLEEFEAASQLSRRINDKRPTEIHKHEKALLHKEQVMRRKLKSRQDFELCKMEEKLYDLKLRLERSQSKERDLTKTRVEIHAKSMEHRTIVSRPEKYCAVRGGKVVPIIKQRKGYKATDSSFRGTQLLDSVQGNAIRNVASLCSLHKFDSGLDTPYTKQ